MLGLLLTLPAASAQFVSPRLPLDSPSQCPTAISQSPTLTYPPRAMTTTTYTTITPTLTAPRTTPLSWLPFPTLRECAEVTLRWAGGLPPFSVQVTARSESHTLFANVTAREADWVCRYKTGNWLAFAVAGEDGMWMQTEVEQFVETGPGECGAWDPPVLFNDSYTPEWGQGAEWTGDEGDYEDGTGEEEEGDEDDGTRVGGAVFSSPWSAARITRTSNSTLPTYSLLDNVVTSSTITSTTSPRTSPLGPIPLSTVWHQPTASATTASATLGAVTAASASDASTSAPVSRAVLAGLAAAIAGLAVLALVAWLLLRRLRRPPPDSPDSEPERKVRRVPPPLDLSRPGSVPSPTSPNPFAAASSTTPVVLVPGRTTVQPRETKASTSPFNVLSPRSRATPVKPRRQASVPLSAQAEGSDFVRQFTPVTPFPLDLRSARKGSGPYPSLNKPRALVPTPYLGYGRDPPQRGMPHRGNTDEESMIASPSEGGFSRRDATLIACAGTPPSYEVACAWTPSDMRPNRGGLV